MFLFERIALGAKLRRGLVREAAVSHSPVGAGDLAWFGGTFGDLADSDVMSQAWQ